MLTAELPPCLDPTAVTASGWHVNTATGLHECWYVDPVTGEQEWVGSVPGVARLVKAFERTTWRVFLRTRSFRLVR